VLFVGYQSEGTLGRALLNGASAVRLFGEEIAVRAQIATMDGVSGHADRDMMLGWLGSLENPPQTVFVNHGDDAACDDFAAVIREKLGYRTVAPYNGGEYDLWDGRCLDEGNRTKIEKRAARRERNNTAYEKCLSAGRELLHVIEQNRGGANKDLAKLESAIRELCRKWQR
jgi:metallo-beta-lactamase family protein